MAHTASPFGPDTDVDVAAYNTIASQITAMKPRALSESQIPDVIVMIEYMRDECLKLHEQNIKLTKMLNERLAEVTRLERESALRRRTLDAALKTHETIGGRLQRVLWRR